MPVMINFKSEMDRYARTLNDIGRRQLPFAASRALNDTAAAAAKKLNGLIPSIFAKAVPFTRNAVVAPKSLQARKDHLVATVTVRPIQAKYLLHEELGGTRTPAENTRRPDARALILPAPALPLNAYRNIPFGKLAKLRLLAAVRPGKHGAGIVFLPATAPGNKAGVGGYFLRDGMKLRRLTGFKAATRYHPKFNYRPHLYASAYETFPVRLRVRLAEAIATARP